MSASNDHTFTGAILVWCIMGNIMALREVISTSHWVGGPISSTPYLRLALYYTEYPWYLAKKLSSKMIADCSTETKSKFITKQMWNTINEYFIVMVYDVSRPYVKYLCYAYTSRRVTRLMFLYTKNVGCSLINWNTGRSGLQCIHNIDTVINISIWTKMGATLRMITTPAFSCIKHLLLIKYILKIKNIPYGLDDWYHDMVSKWLYSSALFYIMDWQRIGDNTWSKQTHSHLYQ